MFVYAQRQSRLRLCLDGEADGRALQETIIRSNACRDRVLASSFFRATDSLHLSGQVIMLYGMVQ